MGNPMSKEKKQEAAIPQQSEEGEASKLYWTCRNGDLEAVRRIVSTCDYSELNCLEPNGSTALHAASKFGHADIVRLLLQDLGVIRHRRNRHGMTAYEEAANDDIRELFKRPNNTRFCTDDCDEFQDLFDINFNNAKDEDDKVPFDWIEGTDTYPDIQMDRLTLKFGITASNSIILRPLMKQIFHVYSSSEHEVTDEASALFAIQRLVDECVTPSHPEYNKACKLIAECKKTKRVEPLLRLYSLQTPFYSNLGREKSNFLLVPLLLKLNSLAKRVFQGRSFRGLTMSKDDLKSYQWGLRRKGRTIKAFSFCSTSVDEAVARMYMPETSTDKVSVLMIFDFPQPCKTAIQLYALSNKLPCISNFEDEREVLIMPLTMFHVTRIDVDADIGQYTIYLENVPPKWSISGVRALRNKIN